MSKIFITGIGTGVGKTIASAVVTESLKADYWKPVQTGSIEGTDSRTVGFLISNELTRIYPEAYCLHLPLSPHAAAKAEKINIRIKNIVIPSTKNNLVIEGAGGLMVPLNNKELMIDFIKETKSKVILVVSHYLGSINHTLLSINAIKEKRIPLAGIIYNGQPNPSSEEAIEAFCKPHVIGRIGHENKFTPPIISKYAKSMYPSLKGLI
jgi:dethiobiotin synthetase